MTTRSRGGMAATLMRRDFGLLWLAGLVSGLGSWATVTALPVFVFRETGSALATTTAFTVGVVPRLFSSVAGVLVDRWDRRRALIWANLALAATTLPLLLAAGSRLVLVYLCLLAQSCCTLVAGPAENALLPRLAPRDHLPAANALNALNDNLARILGPILGTGLLTLGGFGLVIAVDAGTFILAAALVVSIRPPAPLARTADEGEATLGRSGLATEWRDGVRAIGASPLLVALLVAAATTLLGDAMLSSLLAPYVATTLGAGAGVFGLFLTVRGLGGVAGSVVAGTAGRRLSPTTAIVVATTGLAVVVAGLVAFPFVAVALACAALLGVFVVLWLTHQQTLIQTHVPDRYLGRAYGVFGTATAVTLIAGSLLAGVLADQIGVDALFYGAACCYLIAGPVLFAGSRRGTHRTPPSTAPSKEPVTVP